MGIFGWSYPPGVSSIPGDEPFYCEVCGQLDENCICPECPVCGDYGNPHCYRKHGLEFSKYQKISLEYMELKWYKYYQAEAEAYRDEINNSVDYEYYYGKL